jgi:hypothetical protein
MIIKGAVLMRQLAWLLVAGLLAGAGGCNKGPSLKTYPVKGSVTYNGKAVSGATVSYVSTNPDSPVATGITDTDGQFSLSTYVKPTEVLRGVVPGDYKVTITKLPSEANGGAGQVEYSESLSPEERSEQMTKMWEFKKKREAAGGAANASKPKPEIPEKYASVKTSGLNATVVTGENDPREFKLTDE